MQMCVNGRGDGVGGANGSFLKVQSSWSQSWSPEKGPSLPRKPGWAPEHTSSPSCLQSKLVLPPPQCSAAPGLALRLSLRSPKPDPPRVSLAEMCTPLPSPRQYLDTGVFPKNSFLCQNIPAHRLPLGPPLYPNSPGTAPALEKHQ